MAWKVGRCLLLLTTIFYYLSLGNGNLQTGKDELNQMLLSKDVGDTLFKVYSTALTKDWSLLTRKPTNSSACLRDLHALRNDTQKAIKYLDAAGKPRSGILKGNTYWIGSYSECQDISDSHYCGASFSLASPKQDRLAGLLYWGICLPKSCSDKEINEILKNLLQEVEKVTQVPIKYGGTMCPGKASYTTGVKVTFVICGILLLLVLIGTSLDMVDEAFHHSIIKSIQPPSKEHDRKTDISNHVRSLNGATENHGADNILNDDVADHIILLPKKTSRFYGVVSAVKGFFLDFFLCFSLIRTTKKIFDTNVPATAITSINGIRVISITWVLLGHLFGAFVGSPFVENRADMFVDSKLLSFVAVLHGEYSVDSFFFLSGLLVAYTCFRKLQKSGGRFNWVLFYVHRFWRLTPSYMFVVLFSVQLKRFLSTGPFWYMEYHDPLCSKYWWTNLLYVNNFYPTDGKMCIGWSWYLANDMQFFVITPFLLVPLFRVGWHGVVLPLGLIVESSALLAFLYGHYGLDPLAFLRIEKLAENSKKFEQYFRYIYVKPYCRVQPYLIGFLLGYFMFRYAAGRNRPGWILTLVGWLVAAVVALLLVYGPHQSIFSSAEWNTTQNVFYGATERIVWGLVLTWVTFACHYGCGGLVQKFLSARFWIPLSRLTYSVYLIHIIILTLMFTGAEGSIHYNFYTVTYYFLSAIVLSYGAAFILAAVIEFPCDNLENMAHKYFRKVSTRQR